MPENLNWKIVAGAAAGAFLIAFISAGVAGVGFGKMILRGFLGALMFGALGAGLNIVIARFLPELLTPQEQTPRAEDLEPEETGRNVDVVVEDDEGIEAGVYNLEAEAEAEDQEESEDLADDTTGDSGEPAADLEPADELPESAKADTGENVSFNDDTDDSLVEEVEELAPEEDDSEESRESIAAESAEPDADVENLPDVDRFSGSFQDTLEQEEENEQEEPPRKQFSPEQENPFPDQDPETMARAIRTALKRDSE